MSIILISRKSVHRVFNVLRNIEVSSSVPRLFCKCPSKYPQRTVFNFPSTFNPTVSKLQWNLQWYRLKSDKKSGKQRSRQESSDSEEQEEEWKDTIADKHTKVVDLQTKTLRVDFLLKQSLGIARNKIEVLFYESKIRRNGKKLLKKSFAAEEGDELDVVKGVSANNPNFLNVARVEVLKVSEKDEGFVVKVRRTKSLVIEDYPDN